MISFQTDQISDTHILEAENDLELIFHTNNNTLQWNSQLKKQVAATCNPDATEQNTQGSENCGFQTKWSIFDNYLLFHGCSTDDTGFHSGASTTIELQNFQKLARTLQQFSRKLSSKYGDSDLQLSAPPTYSSA